MPDQPIVDRYMSRHVHNYPGSFSEEWDNSSIASSICDLSVIEVNSRAIHLSINMKKKGQRNSKTIDAIGIMIVGCDAVRADQRAIRMGVENRSMENVMDCISKWPLASLRVWKGVPSIHIMA